MASDVLYKWFTLNGGGIKMPAGKLELNEFDSSGRGLCCTKNIPVNSVLLTISEEFLITPRKSATCVFECPCQKLFSKKKIAQSATEAHIVAFLFHENVLEKKSKWYPYIQSLPHFEDDSVLYISQDIEDCLPEFLRILIDNMRNKIRKLYKKWKEVLDAVVKYHKNIDLDTWNIYLRLWFCVNSRSVYCDLKNYNTDSKVVLIPFLDMLNHEPCAQVRTEFNTSENTFMLQTKTAYFAGEQVFINYGPHDNLTLLMEYGFCDLSNEQDCVVLSTDYLCDAFHWSEDSLKRGLEQMGLIIDCGKSVRKEFNLSVDGPSYYLTLLLALCGNIIPDDPFSYEEEFLQLKTHHLCQTLIIYCKKFLQDYIKVIELKNEEKNSKLVNNIVTMLKSWLNICLHLLFSKYKCV